ncbi:UDP-4-amino-4,6-dideoxy-N-acetyl-beta-L-altrosamine transaminase [Nitrogeniibacter mangrovi]|uniref:UDP-4-amino-4, 6-dideoxy-N-acetyl-beta-L-altrosamine transaminase n=1 Tax=Nitrogeniibacter mangrovi TaxID=2016596 RepID=A0A6C1B2B4_9RHOO|nr:UDP-4-amino-4,6-dideoxy-N-acetyl-beta-L-altrosamine transaminase [Nitrogeniibacter mangrovi]QID16968.1 UDP-4-amino-4,6-dideoxy-N-acetyl-beta-L-altrosamine transaminase [Nitrogeniibacter mangrovi]
MIPYGKHHIEEDDIAAVVDVLRSGLITQGPAVEAFEHAVAQYVGARHAVAVSSGTAALHLAALAAGVGPGTTLITSPITFVASANAGLYAGGKVAFADIDPETINMSPNALASALEAHPDTKAVVPVHFAGLPCDMPAIKALADKAGAAVIEDAAHALGATYPDGRRVGCCANSLMTIFSFHPVKAIAAGEGGMITTNDDAVYRRLLRLRSHGINKLDDPFVFEGQAFTGDIQNPWYYEMQELGFHYRISDIQCALGLSQLGKLDAFMKRRRELVANYDAAFSGCEHCRPAQSDRIESSAHHLHVLRIKFKELDISRSEFMMRLRAEGIGTQVHYIPVPWHPVYRSIGADPASCPRAVDFYAEALSIPLFVDLTDEEQARVIQSIQSLVARQRV